MYNALRVRVAGGSVRYGSSQQWNRMTEVVDCPTFEVQTGDLRMARAPRSRKTTRTPHACTYIHTVDMDSDRHVLHFMLCAGVSTLCCAALCSRYCCRYSITYMIQLLYTGTVYIQNVREETKRSNKAQQQCCIRCSRTCWLSNLHTSVVVWNIRESTA